jgi:hypothetical protein
MKLLHTPRIALLSAALFCAGAAQAQQAPMTPQPTLSNQQYSAHQDRIKAEYKAARAACDRMSGNAKDVCVEEAKGGEKVAEAELQYQRSGKPADANKVALVQAEAAYEVAKERCDDLKGADKDACVKDAKAAEARAKADAKAKEKS